MSYAKSFHSFGAATTKALSPFFFFDTWLWQEKLIVRSKVVHSACLEGYQIWEVFRRHIIDSLESNSKDLEYNSKPNQKPECNSNNSSVMWQNFGARYTTLAAAFWKRWGFSIEFLQKLIRAIECKMYLKIQQNLRWLGCISKQTMGSAVKKTRLNSSKDDFLMKSFPSSTKRKLSILLNFLFPFFVF